MSLLIMCLLRAASHSRPAMGITLDG